MDSERELGWDNQAMEVKRYDLDMYGRKREADIGPLVELLNPPPPKKTPGEKTGPTSEPTDMDLIDEDEERELAELMGED